ncbi:TadE family protein [Stratiformator vulcanicus]|nr:pilus assembly protein [Stratiformator vulcanicus]
MKKRRCDDRRRGAALVEFALIAPLFLTLVLGSIDAIRAVQTTTQLSQAIREGGRLASMDWSGVLPDGTTPNEKVEADIENFLNASGITTDDMEINIVHAEGAQKGQPFELGIDENYLELFTIEVGIPQGSSFLNGWVLGSDGVQSSMTFRAGRAQGTG